MRREWAAIAWVVGAGCRAETAPASSTAGNAVIDQKVANVWNRLEQRELKRVSRRISDYGPGQLPAPDQPAGTDLLPQIKHIVVLMMENHSYDNYLGMLPGRGEGFPLGPDGEPEVSNTGTQGESVPAHHLHSTVQLPETPSQSWHATHLQWADGKLDGFVTRDPAADARTRTPPGPWATGPSRTCPSTTGWPGRSRWRTAGSPPAWDPPSRTGGS